MACFHVLGFYLIKVRRVAVRVNPVNIVDRKGPRWSTEIFFHWRHGDEEIVGFCEDLS